MAEQGRDDEAGCPGLSRTLVGSGPSRAAPAIARS